MTEPAGVRLQLRTGDCLDLELVEEESDRPGYRSWVAYGPAGVVIEPGCSLLIDFLPGRSTVSVACRWNGRAGRMELAGRPAG